jgi:hypothetical protein
VASGLSSNGPVVLGARKRLPFDVTDDDARRCPTADASDVVVQGDRAIDSVFRTSRSGSALVTSGSLPHRRLAGYTTRGRETRAKGCTPIISARPPSTPRGSVWRAFAACLLVPRRGIPLPLRAAFAVFHDLDGLSFPGPRGLFHPLTLVGLVAHRG